MAENVSAVQQQHTQSLATVTSNKKESNPQNYVSTPVPKANNSLGSPKVVTAYKIGDSIVLCNSLLQPKESDCITVNSNMVTPSITSNVITPSIASNIITPSITTNVVTPSIVNNIITPSVTKNIVTPSIVQTHSNGPIISSVQSIHSENTNEETAAVNTYCEVLENGLTKVLINRKNIVTEATAVTEGAQSPSQLQSIAKDHDTYTKKKGRRKSPLIPKECSDSEMEKIENSLKKFGYRGKMQKNKDVELEVDVETVDNSFDAANILRSALCKKPEGESDVDISDGECANIYTSTADHLASMYHSKSVKERKRRLLIKSGFENLKASSSHFKNAETCLGILHMALFVVNRQKKKERVFDLAKKRLKYHNTLLMTKLMRLLEGIEPPNVRNKIKTQVIKDLASGRDKCKYKKTVLPLLSEGYKEKSINKPKTERNKSSIDAPDIEIVREKKCLVSDQKQNKEVFEQSTSVLEQVPEKFPQITTCNELKRILTSPPALENASCDILESTKQVNLDLSNCTRSTSEEVKQNSVQDKEKEESSDSDTEDLVSEKNYSDNEVEICTPSKPEKLPEKSSGPVQISLTDESKNKSSETNYPGLIPLFHPKVIKENFNTKNSFVSTPNQEISSRRSNFSSVKSFNQLVNGTNANVFAPNSGVQDEDEDDDVSIIDSNFVSSPVKANGLMPPESCVVSKNDIELTKAAHTASKLFGPCTVQKVQLKCGKTVFAYKTDSSGICSDASPETPISPSLSPTKNGVRNLGDVFHAIQTSKNNVNTNTQSGPEEIVLSDSEDESGSPTRMLCESVSINSAGNSGAYKEKCNEPHSEQIYTNDSDSESERLLIDESDSQNANNSS